MKKELLELICCPHTGKGLRLVAEEADGPEILTGKLTVEGTSVSYPVIKGIPRFVRSADSVYSNYATSFGHQWNHYQWLRDEDQAEFEAIVDRPVEHLRGLDILDVGCGGGRIARFLSPVAKCYIGVDYSHAPERARQLCAGVAQAHFLQADVNHLPFPGRPQFDFIFSHGVLHHTPDTRRSFGHLPPLLRDDGELYIAVFRQALGLLRWSDAAVRALVNKLPLPWQERFCRALRALQWLPAASFWKRFFWFSLQKDPEVAACCNFDWYAPTHHHEHTAVEVMNWFAEEGFRAIHYINAWPYCPAEERFRIAGFRDSFRLGQLLGVVGQKRRPPLIQAAQGRRAA